jgi:hypothetical protein
MGGGSWQYLSGTGTGTGKYIKAGNKKARRQGTGIGTRRCVKAGKQEEMKTGKEQSWDGG